MVFGFRFGCGCVWGLFVQAVRERRRGRRVNRRASWINFWVMVFGFFMLVALILSINKGGFLGFVNVVVARGGDGCSDAG